MSKVFFFPSCFDLDRFLLGYVFIILPIADMFTGWLVLSSYLTEGGFGSPSQIFRAILLPLLFFRLSVGIRPVWLIVPLYLFFIETVHVFFHQSLLSYLYGVIFFSKILYLSMLCAVLVTFFRAGMASMIFNYMAFGMLLISFSLILAHISDTGFGTYIKGFGTKGYFSSGNGLGLNLGIFLLLLVYVYHARLCDWFFLRYIVVFGLIAIFLVGSKTAWLLGFFSLISFSCYNRWKVFFVFLFSLGLLFVFVPGEFFSQLFSEIILRYNSAPDLLTFITSGRNNYFFDAWSIYLEQGKGFWNILWGNGYFCSFQKCETVVYFDTLESDAADIFFMYGVFGLMVYFLFFLVIARGLFIRGKYFVFFVWMLLFGHSAVAGHVLQNGMNLTLIAVFMALSYFIISKFDAEAIK